MTPPRRERLAAPDVLRVAAIFIVAWFHIWQQSWLDPGFMVGSHYVNLQQIVRHGYMMVDELLLLSGFLLALPCARRQLRGLAQEPPEEHYRRRFWRIVPSYYLTILIMLYGWAIPQGLYRSGWAMAKDLWAHFTFTHTLFYDSYLLSPLSGVLWTLAVEVQFYILWPLIARAFTKRPALTCGTMVVLAFTYRAWVYGEQDCSMYFNQLPAQLDLYACGMAAALIFARLEVSDKPSMTARRVLAPAGMVFAFLGMLLVMYLQPVGDYEAIRHGQMDWRPALGLLGGAFLVCGCLAPPKLAHALDNPVTRVLADISFNFYMWHQFLALRWKDWHIPPYVAAQPNQAYEQPWQTIYTVVCFVFAAIIAAALTYFWEKPVQRWGLRITKPPEKDPES